MNKFFKRYLLIMFLFFSGVIFPMKSISEGNVVLNLEHRLIDNHTYIVSAHIINDTAYNLNILFQILQNGEWTTIRIFPNITNSQTVISATMPIDQTILLTRVLGQLY